MENFGVPSQLAKGFVDMFDSMYKGELAKDFYLHQPTILGKTKLEDFAKDFAIAYNQLQSCIIYNTKPRHIKDVGEYHQYKDLSKPERW